jgi:hypothetical protein
MEEDNMENVLEAGAQGAVMGGLLMLVVFVFQGLAVLIRRATRKTAEPKRLSMEDYIIPRAKTKRVPMLSTPYVSPGKREPRAQVSGEANWGTIYTAVLTVMLIILIYSLATTT